MSESVAEIQSRIDSISADIIRQKEVLANLERSKSAAQRQLNTIRDPVARLPLEISSDIFARCLSPWPQTRTRVHDAPMLLMNICNGWTDIALSTPALWTAVHLHEPLAHLLVAWIKRAGSHALSISLPIEVTDEISAIMRRHAHQLRDLKMYQDISFVAAWGPFPLLKTLTIAGGEQFTSIINPVRCSASATLGMLLLCPNLVECTFDKAVFQQDYSGEMIVHAHMQHLEFGKDLSWSDDSLLRNLCLPGLETLSIPFLDLRHDDLLQFSSRSSPPLQKLVLRHVLRWSLHEMEELLSILSTLAHFELVRPQGVAAPNNFLTILTNSPHLLPNLSTIIFQDCNVTVSYPNLLSALLARRTQLQIVHITGSGCTPFPSEDITVQLCQLVAEGMSIHVGTIEQNYI
ncbi:hypothetical protein B0H17DRAFT_1179422 [Mycena rosella]|uniref:F-box domain-containing protein n=1 Tax=Mycena rosella TaxID=1033263 RepID=A0AAD7DHY8_MYCRO|nr:hypothetical protein B0H17DRAFT_1179422 [Mycena rosella]